MIRPPRISTLFPSPPLFRSPDFIELRIPPQPTERKLVDVAVAAEHLEDRKSTRLNSSHLVISYAVFCLKKKKLIHPTPVPRDRYPLRPHAAPLTHQH